MTTEMPARPSDTPPRWQPVRATDRRVLGVLIEKAKTTPDAYPLSLNALVTGANQKNNRAPLTQLTPEDVEESVDRLRQLGAVAAVQGSSRVGRYRHYMYEWMGVDKVELGVMAELLLRGAQTVGELRGRVARMEPIADLSALRPVLESLTTKGLIQSLSPDGRGQVITHTLYLPEEMEKVHRQHAAAGSTTQAGGPPAAAAPRPPRPVEHAAETEQPLFASRPPTIGGSKTESAATGAGEAALRDEISELRASLAQLKADFAELTDSVDRSAADLKRLQQALGE